MGLLNLLRYDPRSFFMLVPILLYSVIFHEMAHGVAAYIFGDDSAKRDGRFSLNPISHLHPIGTLTVFIFGFGWAKPVPVNFAKLKPRRIGMFIVAMAGCFVNIVIAAIAIYIVSFTNMIDPKSSLAQMVKIIAYINVTLAALNLIPIPPLDGSKMLISVLPASFKTRFESFEVVGLIITLSLLAMGALWPFINIIQNKIFQCIGLVLNYIGS